MFRVKLENGTTFEVPNEVEAKGPEAVDAFMVSKGYPTAKEREARAKKLEAERAAAAKKEAATQTPATDQAGPTGAAEPTKES